MAKFDDTGTSDDIEPFDQDAAKRAAAARALDFVTPGMRLGLGTGSTAAAFVALLGERVAQGLEIIGVPTSERTAAQARGLAVEPCRDNHMAHIPNPTCEELERLRLR